MTRPDQHADDIAQNNMQRARSPGPKRAGRRRLLRALGACLGLTVLAIPCNAFGRILNVPGAYPSINEAITAAFPGDTVRVAPGRYLENVVFGGKDLTLTGHDPDNWSTVVSTIIDGNANGSTVSLVDHETRATVIDGLTITGGTGTPLDLDEALHAGGGIYLRSSSPTIRRCIIRNNATDYLGGGIAMVYSEALVTNCLFEDNLGAWLGGGIYLRKSAPIIEASSFRGNWTTDDGGGGGGLFCGALSQVTLRRCVIAENSSAYRGGGLFFDLDATGLVEYCVIDGNTASDFGGGFHSWSSTPTLRNSIFTRNESASAGGGFSCNFASPAIEYCTITENSAPHAAGLYAQSMSAATVTNSILWNDETANSEIYLQNSPVTITHSDVRGGWPGSGNLDSDPSFTRYRNYEYVLAPGSPCIDTADGPNDATDWCAIHPAYCRWNQPAPDMGAYGGPENEGWLGN